jgi:hypothetical protein
MDAFKFPFALFAFFGFVAIVPAWMFFLNGYSPASDLRPTDRFLATMVLPALASLFLASWLQE